MGQASSQPKEHSQVFTQPNELDILVPTTPSIKQEDLTSPAKELLSTQVQEEYLPLLYQDPPVWTSQTNANQEATTIDSPVELPTADSANMSKKRKLSTEAGKQERKRAKKERRLSTTDISATPELSGLSKAERKARKKARKQEARLERRRLAEDASSQAQSRDEQGVRGDEDQAIEDHEADSNTLPGAQIRSNAWASRVPVQDTPTRLSRELGLASKNRIRDQLISVKRQESPSVASTLHQKPARNGSKHVNAGLEARQVQLQYMKHESQSPKENTTLGSLFRNSGLLTPGELENQSKKRKRSKSKARDQDRQSPKVNEDQFAADIAGEVVAGPKHHTGLSKAKKNKHKNRTISDLTAHNTDSQSFKSAKIKLIQDLAAHEDTATAEQSDSAAQPKKKHKKHKKDKKKKDRTGRAVDDQHVDEGDQADDSLVAEPAHAGPVYTDGSTITRQHDHEATLEGGTFLEDASQLDELVGAPRTSSSQGLVGSEEALQKRLEEQAQGSPAPSSLASVIEELDRVATTSVDRAMDDAGSDVASEQDLIMDEEKDVLRSEEEEDEENAEDESAEFDGASDEAIAAGEVENSNELEDEDAAVEDDAESEEEDVENGEHDSIIGTTPAIQEEASVVHEDQDNADDGKSNPGDDASITEAQNEPDAAISCDDQPESDEDSSAAEDDEPDIKAESPRSAPESRIRATTPKSTASPQSQSSPPVATVPNQAKTKTPARSKSTGFKSAEFIMDSDNEQETSVSRIRNNVVAPSSRPDEDDEEPEAAPKSYTPRRLPVAQRSPASSTKAPKTYKTNSKKPRPSTSVKVATGKRKTGTFDDEEKATLDGFRSTYKRLHGLSNGDFIRRVHKNAHNSKELGSFWEDMREYLPDRDKKALQRFTRRHWPITNNRGPFSQEEDDDLVSYVKKYDRKPPISWAHIGQEMDRPAEVCRDRWRNVLQHRETRAEEKRWTSEHIMLLRHAMGNVALASVEVSGGSISSLERSVFWGSVSTKMNGLKGRAQCSHKWNKLKAKGVVSLIDELRAANARRQAEWDNGSRAGKDKPLDLSRYNLDEFSMLADEKSMTAGAEEHEDSAIGNKQASIQSWLNETESQHAASSLQSAPKAKDQSSSKLKSKSKSQKSATKVKKHTALRDKGEDARPALAPSPASSAESDADDSIIAAPRDDKKAAEADLTTNFKPVNPFNNKALAKQICPEATSNLADDSEEEIPITKSKAGKIYVDESASETSNDEGSEEDDEEED